MRGCPLLAMVEGDYECAARVSRALTGRRSPPSPVPVLHRPLASVDGSVNENTNNTGVQTVDRMP